MDFDVQPAADAAGKLNFQITDPDKISDIMDSLKGKLFLLGLGKDLMKQMKGSGSGGGMADMMPSGDGLMQMLGGFSILRLTSLMSMAGITFTKEQLLDINAKLNKIKKK